MNLAQALVTEDPRLKILARLKAGTRIAAIEPAWTQADYRGDAYLYIRDGQDIVVRTSSGLTRCVNFGDSMTDDGRVRDSGLQRYLNDTMTQAEHQAEFTLGGAPDSESIEMLDAQQHYASVADLNADNGTNF